MIVPVGSTAWLLVHELRLARRGLLAKRGMKWRVPLVLLAFLVTGAFAGVPAALALKRFGLPSNGLVAAVIAVVSLGAFTLMLSQSLAAATETLYSRADLDLLLSSPIPPRRVLFAKCTGIAANAFLAFATLATPLAIPVAVIADPRFLAIYVVLASLALLAAASGLGVAVGLFRLIGPKRTRTISQLLAVLFGSVVFLTAQSRNIIGQTRFNRWFGGLTSIGKTGDSIHGPVTWPLRAVSGDPVTLLALLTLACTGFAAATVWVGRRFGADAAAASGVAGRKAPVKGGGEGVFAAGAFRVTLLKELRLLVRDIPLLAQVMLRVVYLLPLIFLLLRNAGGHGVARLAAGVGSVAFVCGQVAGSLVWLTVAAEDAPELLGCAPVSRVTIRRAKLCAALSPLAGLLIVPVLVLVALAPLAGMAAAAGCGAAALSSALIGFALQKPAKRSTFRQRRSGSLVSSLVEFAAGGAVAVSAGFAVVWPPLLLAPIAVAVALAWTLWRDEEPSPFPLPNALAVVH